MATIRYQNTLFVLNKHKNTKPCVCVCMRARACVYMIALAGRMRLLNISNGDTWNIWLRGEPLGKHPTDTGVCRIRTGNLEVCRQRSALITALLERPCTRPSECAWVCTIKKQTEW